MASTINFDFALGFAIDFGSLDFEAYSAGRLRLVNRDYNLAISFEARSLEAIPITTTDSADLDATDLTTRSPNSVEFPFGLDNQATIMAAAQSVVQGPCLNQSLTLKMASKPSSSS